jgi:hypothetical protein
MSKQHKISKLNTQNLAIVANFLTIEQAWYFLTDFGKNFSFASTCSQTFRPYPKFEYAYWFDWILVVEDLNVAREAIKNCFGSGWIESGDDEIWNAADKQELSVPIWVNLLQPNLISVDEARQLNPKPQMEQGSTFISISTKGELTCIYPSSKILGDDL